MGFLATFFLDKFIKGELLKKIWWSLILELIYINMKETMTADIFQKKKIFYYRNGQYFVLICFTDLYKLVVI